MHLDHFKFRVAKNHFHFFSSTTKIVPKFPLYLEPECISNSRSRKSVPSFLRLCVTCCSTCGRLRKGGRKEGGKGRKKATDRPTAHRPRERGARPTPPMVGGRERAAVWQERAAQCYGLMYACQEQEGRKEGSVCERNSFEYCVKIHIVPRSHGGNFVQSSGDVTRRKELRSGGNLPSVERGLLLRELDGTTVHLTPSACRTRSQCSHSTK